MPRPAEIAGDFSARRDLTLRDPFTATASTPGIPFPGNIIPQNRLDPVGAAVAKLFLIPNLSSDPTRIAVNNYNVTGTDQLNQNFYVTRWDHIFNSNNRIYVRYMYVNSFDVAGNVFPTLYADFRKTRSDNGNNVIYGSYTHNFTPMLFNEIRVNVGRRSNFVAAGGTGSSQNKTLGIKGVDETGFARFNATGYASLGSTAQARYQFPIDTRELIDTASWIHGNHVVRFGGGYRISKNDDVNSPTASGQFSYLNRAAGDTIGEMLLGFVNSGRQEVTDRITSRSDYIASSFRTTGSSQRTLR